MSIRLDPDFEKMLFSLNDNEDYEYVNVTETKKDNKDSEYIKSIIKESILQCNKKVESINTLIEDFYIYNCVGLTDQDVSYLENIKFKFETVIPSILLGNYDELLMYEKNTEDVEELERIYTNIRKKLINNIINNNK